MEAKDDLERAALAAQQELELEEQDENKGLPAATNVVPRILYSEDVNWHLQDRDNTNMNSLRVGPDGKDTSGTPIASISRFLTNSCDRIGRMMTNPNMNLKDINRRTALVMFNKIAEQFNMHKMEMLKNDCPDFVFATIGSLWLNGAVPKFFFDYVHSWDNISIYMSDSKVEKFNATASYFNMHMPEILFCIEKRFNAITYATQMCTAPVYYASNVNHTKFVQSLHELNNGGVNGADYYKNSFQRQQQQMFVPQQLQQQYHKIKLR